MEPCDLSLDFWEKSRQLGWDCIPDCNTDALVVRTDNRASAIYVFKNFRKVLQSWAVRFGLSLILIKYGDNSWDFIDASTSPSKASILGNKFTNNPFFPISTGVHMQSSDLTNLYGADYLRILDFLREERLRGNIVVITSNTTNICYHTNDLLLPSRGVLLPYQWTGFDYSVSWRNSLGGIGQLESLKNHLERSLNKCVKDFEYNLERPDTAQVKYVTTYLLCRDFLGDEVRIGISRPQDYSVIREPREMVLN